MLFQKISCKVLQAKQLCTAHHGEFKTVYKFPYIRGIGVINRLKLYQTVLTSISLPTSAILHQISILPLDGVTFTAALCVGGLFPLYSFGFFANKLIGIIYLNEKDDYVKLAYLDFWGNRKDKIIPVKEIMPFSDDPTRSITNILYLKVRQFSNNETLKLCTKYGILDYNKFNKIFLS